MMQPLGKIKLSSDASEFSRIGDNVRDERAKGVEWLESVIEEECPITLTCDVRAIHSPLFTEFMYFDVIGGLLLNAMSAEISARVSQKVSVMGRDADFNMDWVFDKYVLRDSGKRYKKVLFLAGSNSTHLMDQMLIQKVMDSDPQWMIKPHPVTNDQTIRELASIWGYSRIIHPKESGNALLRHCEEFAATHCSELFIVGRLMGKPVTDITRYDRAWFATYHAICRLIDNTDADFERINNCLMSEYGGYVRPEYTDGKVRTFARNYYNMCLEERRSFEMITTQRLTIADKTFRNWNEPPKG